MPTEINVIDQADIDSLVTECREKLDLVDADLMALGDGKDVSKDVINRIFRVFHSVKGAGGFLQHEPLKELSHLTESVLEKVRDGSLTLSHAHIDVLLASADRLRQMVAGDEIRLDVDFRLERKALEAILHSGNPIVAAPKPAVRAERPLTPAIPVTHARRLKVLVVEDDFSSRLLLQGLLSVYGECHFAMNGKEAVEAFASARKTDHGYDLICMDINMPEMDGRTAVAEIRALEAEEGIFNSAVKIFMTTSNTDMKSVVASYRVLCDAYITKPIDGASFREQLACFQLASKS